MGIKDTIREKYESYKKKHNEEVAYGKIIEAKATAARRKAYAEEYETASAKAARVKARADVSGGSAGSSNGFFSGIVKANQNSFSDFGLPQGQTVMGNNPFFNQSSAPRITHRRAKLQRKYYYAPIRAKPKRPQRRRIYYSAPKRHSRSRTKTVRQDTYGFGSMGW